TVGFYGGHPGNIAQIECWRVLGMCELTTAEGNPDGINLVGAGSFLYPITAWESARVVAKQVHGCGTSLMTIEIQSKSVTVDWLQNPNVSCGPPSSFPPTWSFVDQPAPHYWKIHQDKVNKARDLVYEPARRLVPPVADYTRPR